MSSNKPTRSVLDLSPQEARAFFLKSESYSSLDLPPYFDFKKVLHAVHKCLTATPLNIHELKARNYEDVNYTLYSNKDGRYAWRPFQLIHPILYVELVHRMTAPQAWDDIRTKLKSFQRDRNIRCLSIPQRASISQRDRAAQIHHWWQSIEQASIELALDYNFVFHADIADCYASIYTHSIAWALHSKETAKKEQRNFELIGNVIDRCIQHMQHGQTNGIPQGSVLMDLVAELVLGYADSELSEALRGAGITDFTLLRYRDDYRIFVNDSHTGERILKALTEVLLSLGLKLNVSKTTDAKLVVQGSLKIDKLAWIRSRRWDQNLQKHLLLIHSHGNDYPNAGSLVAALDKFYDRLSRRKSVHNPIQLISIAVDIGYNNPRCFPVCAAIVSRVLSMLRKKSQKLELIMRIQRRLQKLPNNGHLEVWLQRISYPFERNVGYTEKLCKLVEGENVDLWNSSWINDKSLKDAVDPQSIVNRKLLASLRPVVTRKEFAVFDKY